MSIVNYGVSKHFAGSMVSDRCPLGYLLGILGEAELLLGIWEQRQILLGRRGHYFQGDGEIGYFSHCFILEFSLLNDLKEVINKEIVHLLMQAPNLAY